MDCPSYCTYFRKRTKSIQALSMILWDILQQKPLNYFIISFPNRLISFIAIRIPTDISQQPDNFQSLSINIAFQPILDTITAFVLHNDGGIHYDTTAFLGCTDPITADFISTRGKIERLCVFCCDVY